MELTAEFKKKYFKYNKRFIKLMDFTFCCEMNIKKRGMEKNYFKLYMARSV